MNITGQNKPFYTASSINAIQFNRASIDVFPISYGVWLTDKNACVDAIKAKFH
ncbi:MAG: hypothetical protein IMF17_01465 [Proteobacteria bacterium]|nr:hypothetical protein [Pseudomonadota bacterium]